MSGSQPNAPLDYATATTDAESPRRSSSLIFWTIFTALIVLLVSILMPAFANPKKPSLVLSCAAHVRNLSTAIMIYRQENGGQFPPDLASIPSRFVPQTSVFLCPAHSRTTNPARFTDDVTARTSGDLSYVYTGKGLMKPSPREPILFERLSHHSKHDKCNVGFADGSVKILSRSEVTKLLEPLRGTPRLTDEEYQFLIAR